MPLTDSKGLRKQTLPLNYRPTLARQPTLEAAFTAQVDDLFSDAASHAKSSATSGIARNDEVASY